MADFKVRTPIPDVSNADPATSSVQTTLSSGESTLLQVDIYVRITYLRTLYLFGRLFLGPGAKNK